MNWRTKMIDKKLYSMIVIIILTLLQIGCTEKPEEHNDEHKEGHSDIVTLSTESIEQIKLESQIISMQPFSGTIKIPAEVKINQDYEAQIGSLIQGRVHKVFVKVGDYVKAGQLLMTVEGLEVGEIKAGYLKAKANYDNAKANYERQTKLYDEKIGSQKSLLESQAEFEKATAEYRAEDKKIHSVGLSDEDVMNEKDGDEHTSGTLPIKSLINGVVVERNVVIGQLVDATTNAFKIINTSSVWIDGQLYEKDANRISENSDVYFTSSTYPGEKFNAKLNYVGKVIDESTRTITIRAELNNPTGKLKPQMFGELHISSGKNSNALLMPIESVVKIDNDDFVFVLENDSVFQKRAIQLGSTQNGMVEIVNGVKEGERVVVKGSFYLKSEIMKNEIEEHEH